MQNSYSGFAVRALHLVQKAVRDNEKSEFYLANQIYKLKLTKPQYRDLKQSGTPNRKQNLWLKRVR